jgi:hypothetical protein
VRTDDPGFSKWTMQFEGDIRTGRALQQGLQFYVFSDKAQE